MTQKNLDTQRRTRFPLSVMCKQLTLFHPYILCSGSEITSILRGLFLSVTRSETDFFFFFLFFLFPPRTCLLLTENQSSSLLRSDLMNLSLNIYIYIVYKILNETIFCEKKKKKKSRFNEEEACHHPSFDI